MIQQSTAQFWDKTAESFDAIYTGRQKGWLGILLDRWLRRDIYQRIDATVQSVNAMGPNQTILDVGTGTGRLCVPLARAGHTVVGVDFSPVMLKMAEVLVNKAGVKERCTFLQGDMLLSPPEELNRYAHFDAVAALGVLDYIPDPMPMFEKMLAFSPQRIIVSFPKRGTVRSYVRRLRYRLQGLDCPLYFYTPEQIGMFGQAMGAASTRMDSMGELYFTVFDFDKATC